MGKCRQIETAWWLVRLPLWKMMDFASWDDDITNWMEKWKKTKPPTRNGTSINKGTLLVGWCSLFFDRLQYIHISIHQKKAPHGKILLVALQKRVETIAVLQKIETWNSQTSIESPQNEFGDVWECFLPAEKWPLLFFWMSILDHSHLECSSHAS